MEDEPDVRELLAELLREYGYRVLVAEHGREALVQLASNEVCLILLDLMMPQMDGWDFRAEQLRRPAIAHIPVVVVSAGGDAETNAERLQADAALRKPIQVERLLDLVRRYCPAPRVP